MAQIQALERCLLLDESTIAVPSDLLLDDGSGCLLLDDQSIAEVSMSSAEVLYQVAALDAQASMASAEVLYRPTSTAGFVSMVSVEALINFPPRVSMTSLEVLKVYIGKSNLIIGMGGTDTKQ